MKSLFHDRALVKIADVYRENGIVSMSKHPMSARARAKLSLDATGRVDVGDQTLSAIEHAFSGDGVRGGSVDMFNAYWMCHDAKLRPVESRLLVNPPSILDPQSKYVHTYQVYGEFGSYGARSTPVKLTSIVATNIPGSVKGYFDDIAVFWDLGVTDHGILFDRALQGTTTLTLLWPAQEDNVFWLGYFDIVNRYSELLKAAASKFNVDVVFESVSNGVRIEVYGLSAK